MNFYLIIPGFSTFRVHQAGYSRVKDGDEVCQGVDSVRNRELEKRLVEYSIYTVTISPEKFLSDSQAMVAASTQETLTCNPASGRCPGELHSYTWNTSPHSKCPYSLVKRATGVISPATFFSHEETLVFAKHPALLPIVRLSALVEALGAYVQDALELHQGQLQEQTMCQHCLLAQQVVLQEVWKEARRRLATIHLYRDNSTGTGS